MKQGSALKHRADTVRTSSDVCRSRKCASGADGHSPPTAEPSLWEAAHRGGAGPDARSHRFFLSGSGRFPGRHSRQAVGADLELRRTPDGRAGVGHARPGSRGASEHQARASSGHLLRATLLSPVCSMRSSGHRHWGPRRGRKGSHRSPPGARKRGGLAVHLPRCKAKPQKSVIAGPKGMRSCFRGRGSSDLSVPVNPTRPRGFSGSGPWCRAAAREAGLLTGFG